MVEPPVAVAVLAPLREEVERVLADFFATQRRGGIGGTRVAARLSYAAPRLETPGFAAASFAYPVSRLGPSSDWMSETWPATTLS